VRGCGGERERDDGDEWQDAGRHYDLSVGDGFTRRRVRA
jgi:hypothetical protein